MATSKKPKQGKPAPKKAAKPAPAKFARKAPAPARLPGEPKPRKRPTREDVQAADPALFAPLTPGEVADALRTLTEDNRVGNMAKVGRYRVIVTEPLVVKPPHWMAGHRLARVVIYDYAADRCVDACVDLDAGIVAHLEVSRAQPMLSREEEAQAIHIALADERVRAKLSLGDEAMIAPHYWGRQASDLAFSRRAAAVVFGRPGGHPSVVAVVDLLDSLVSDVVPAAQW